MCRCHHTPYILPLTQIPSSNCTNIYQLDMATGRGGTGTGIASPVPDSDSPTYARTRIHPQYPTC